MNNFSLDKVRDIAARAVSPIELPPEAQGSARGYQVFKGIPHHEYYLIFLLLVDLLGFKYSGPFEKVAYIIPLGYKGMRYTVVYAKFGMRIECPEDGNPEDVYAALRRGMKAAKKYYLWRAAEASATSNCQSAPKIDPYRRPKLTPSGTTGAGPMRCSLHTAQPRRASGVSVIRGS